MKSNNIIQVIQALRTSLAGYNIKRNKEGHDGEFSYMTPLKMNFLPGIHP